MNTRDREYLEALTNSIAVANQSSIIAFEALQRAIEETNVKLGLFAEQIAKLNLDAIRETPTQRELAEETLDYNGWGGLAVSGVFKQEEAHPMIKNNKFVDDGSAFQDEMDKTPRVSPVERKRQQWESHLIETTCSRCNKTEKINKVHATGSIHVCQRCARR